MALDWKAISDNIVNISQVLADFLDTVTSKDVEWVFIDDEGNVNNIKLPNLAKINNLFGKKYLGSSDSEPTEHADGTDLETGDMYFDNESKSSKVYDGTNWKPVADYRNMTVAKFTGDGDTKEFAVDNGFTPDKGMVFLNGSDVTSDVDISDGANIKFSTAPKDGDEIVGYFFNTFEVADTITTSGGSSTGDIKISKSDKGFVLVDRKDGKEYRLYVEDGNLGLEEV